MATNHHAVLIPSGVSTSGTERQLVPYKDLVLHAIHFRSLCNSLTPSINLHNGA